MKTHTRVWKYQKPKASAVIGIGSNSTRMLVCMSDNPYRVIDRGYALTRIFENMDSEQMISKKSIVEAVKSIVEMLKVANKKYNLVQSWIFATSALRDAKNNLEIIKPVFDNTGINIQILSGEEEAYYSFLGAGAHQPKETSYAVIDIGGGSTEFAVGNKIEGPKTLSLQLGAMRLMQEFPDVSINTLDALICHIEKTLIRQKISVEENIKTYIGVGGAFSTLEILYNKRKRYGRSFFTKKQINEKMLDLFTIAIEKRDDYPRMPKGRGDITPYGFAIIHTLMDYLDFDSLEVVRKGNLDGWLIAHVG